MAFSWFIHHFVKRDHCTALWAVQHPSTTPTLVFMGWGEGERLREINRWLPILVKLRLKSRP